MGHEIWQYLISHWSLVTLMLVLSLFWFCVGQIVGLRRVNVLIDAQRYASESATSELGAHIEGMQQDVVSRIQELHNEIGKLDELLDVLEEENRNDAKKAS